jgi:signal transduction histidine kinase/DNA-binding response OmpR family regulator
MECLTVREHPLALVVDDEEFSRICAKRSLENAGFSVEQAGNGIQALLQFDRLRPDIVLLDVMMEEMDGFTACAEIRKRGEGQKTPILMMTSLDDVASINRAYEVGATDFVTKPINWTVLSHRVRNLLRTCRAAEERTLLNQVLLDSFPCVALLLKPHTREIVASNKAAGKVDAVPGKKCYSTWGKRENPCPWCLAPSLWSTGEVQHKIVKTPGAAWDAHWIPVTKNLYMHFAFDITESVRTEEMLREKEEQFLQAQKMEAVGRLAGGIAHDFNNFLTAINGYSDLMISRLKEADPLRSEAEEIRKAGKRAATLTRQLLAFSRKQVLQPKVLDLNSIIAGIGSMLMRLIGEDIELVTFPGEGLGSVKADPCQIEQIIMNLAINSRDAMPEGGKLTLETSNLEIAGTYIRERATVNAGRYVVLAVSDTGCGMDDATKSRLFEPFFTTKEIGKGTGLGLATVYGIVKQSGGYIWCYSEVRRGTCFKIYLPRVDEKAEAIKQEYILPDGPLRGTETVLVVEDEEAVCQLVTECLKMRGYNVLSASDGAKALMVSEYHKGPIHLVVSDVVMPGMKGPEVAKKISETRPDVKVLFMSGYSDAAVVHHGILGADNSFIEKPFGLENMAKKVREILDRNRENL